MKILKPKFWEENNSLISLLLLPISFIVKLFIIIKKGITLERSFKIPVICIGNIYLGGTGKTPLSILIAKELRKNNKKPAIVKKYYADHVDEHGLIKDNLDCLFLHKKRSQAINNAQEKKYDLAILDDGFQDYSIKKDLNILCFNSNQLIGNGMTLPAGPLRESLNSVRKTQIVLINGNKNKLFEEKILSISNNVKIFYSRYIPQNLEEFKNKKLIAFAGIGNPDNFFSLLEDNDVKIHSKLAFPDHYKFNRSEIQKMVDESIKSKMELVTTEKDYFRIKEYGFKHIKFLKVKLEILEKDNFIKQVLNYI